jgi:hypothetical protein
MMMILRKGVGTLALMTTVSACGGAPTAAVADAARPSYDAGYRMGSGNWQAPSDSTMGLTAESAGREGYTMGSGN